MANCPKCGSDHISFQREYVGSTGTTKYYRHHKRRSWLVSAGERRNTRTSRRQTIALCKDCGYSWKVNSGIGADSGSLGCGTLLLVVILISAIGRFFGSGGSNKEDKVSELQETKTVEVQSVMADEAQNSSSDNTSVKSDNWVFPILTDFDYDYEDGGITLKSYQGTATSIIIPSSYDVEGETLAVLELDSTFKDNHALRNVAISEGIQTLLTDTFHNCSKLKHVFIPSSVTNFSTVLESFMDGEVLYYGGNQEQWDKLRKGIVSRSEIHFKQIVLNATLEDCLNGIESVADISENPGNDYISLANFRYDVTAEGIVLESYQGDDTFVSIAPVYIVDGEELPVYKLDNTFALGKVDTVIVPEGVKELSKAVFNSCGIQKLYLPKSLVKVEEGFWKYFFDVDTIYFGGTEEEFSAICPIDRFDIDVKHLEYEALPDVLKQ